MTRATSSILLALVVAGLALGACSGGGDPQAAPDPDPLTGSAATSNQPDGATIMLASDSPTADDYHKLVASEDGLSELQPVQILDAATPVGTPVGTPAGLSPQPQLGASVPQGLVVSFEMQSHHCYGIHVSVTESDTEVVLDLQTGRRDGVPPTACTYGVYPYSTEVTLASPLGGRSLTTSAERPAQTSGAASGGTSPTRVPAATATDGQTDPAAIDPSLIPALDVDRYVGQHVEDGVEWALANDRPWRIVSEDGEARPDDSGADRERLSFTVVADVIVAYEWS
jgi:hypothetical protein